MGATSWTVSGEVAQSTIGDEPGRRRIAAIVSPMMQQSVIVTLRSPAPAAVLMMRKRSKTLWERGPSRAL